MVSRLVTLVGLLILGVGLVLTFRDPVKSAQSVTQRSGNRLAAHPEQIVVNAKSGSRQEIEFELVNESLDDISLKKMTGTCSCTEIKTDLPPLLRQNDSITIKALVSVPSAGTTNAKISIQHNDSRGSHTLEIPLAISATDQKVPAIIGSPDRIYEVTYQSHRPVSRFFEIRTHEEQPEPWLKGIVSSNSEISATIVNSDLIGPEGALDFFRSYQCELVSMPPGDIGDYVNGQLTFLDSDGRPVIKGSVPVAITRAPAINVYPEAVTLMKQAGPGDEPFFASVSVELAEGEDLPDWDAVDWSPLPASLNAEWLESNGKDRLRTLQLTSSKPFDNCEVSFVIKGQIVSEQSIMVRCQNEEQ